VRARACVCACVCVRARPLYTGYIAISVCDSAMLHERVIGRPV
jgi:hypothetical protein